MSRHFAWIFCFLAACASSVTQDGPQDPTNVPDASPDGPPVVVDAGPQLVGRPCTADNDCASDMFCHPIPAGGYCSFYCNGDTDCPSGTVCSPVPYTRVTGLCMTTCTTSADCRDGHACAELSLFAGPGGPMSSTPVCWAPQDGGP
jgi:hypothetical protein